MHESSRTLHKLEVQSLLFPQPGHLVHLLITQKAQLKLVLIPNMIICFSSLMVAISVFPQVSILEGEIVYLFQLLSIISQNDIRNKGENNVFLYM